MHLTFNQEILSVRVRLRTPMKSNIINKLIPKDILLAQIELGLSKRKISENLKCDRRVVDKCLSYYGINYRCKKNTASPTELYVRKQNKCVLCGKTFDKYAIVDGKKVDLRKRKHCLECLPYKQGSGSLRRKIVVKNYCKICGEPLKSKNSVYCSNSCYQKELYYEYIKRWQSGEEDGIVGEQWKDLSLYIKRYLFEKYNNKCAKCGWSKRNPYTNTLPLEIEHIDGNALNNKEENLILLCPNCHSLTKTYRGANRGNGKRNIKWLSRDGNL